MGYCRGGGSCYWVSLLRWVLRSQSSPITKMTDQTHFSASATGNTQIAPDACTRFEPYLSSHIVGQDLALRQISDAVCDHLANPSPTKPLVLSIHGPPGVGKSMFHQLAAPALYSTKPGPHLRCPGPDCAGYKVLFGVDYTEDDRAAQHAMLRNAIFTHVSKAPESLLVIEEYDKLDCHMRGFFRQLLDGGTVGNVSLAKSIVILESNTGFMKLHDMLEAAGARERISPELAQRTLKDLVFERWKAQGCEERDDTIKMVGIVNYFLPFFPLEKQHIEKLFGMRLVAKSEELAARRLGAVAWAPSVVDFLTAKVEFEGRYPIEGGKEVGTMMTRYVSRPLREWEAAQVERLRKAEKEGTAQRAEREPVGKGRLEVAPNGAELRIVPA